MTKKKLSDQINDWPRWESHSKTLADEAKKCGSNVTNDDTVSESERGEKLQTMACLEPGTQPRPSQRQPCEFSEMLAALQNDISSLPRE